MSVRFRFLVTVSFAAIVSTVITAKAKNPEDETFEAFFKEQLERQLRERPVLATDLGDHRYDHLIEDISTKARDGWTQRSRDRLAKLNKEIAYEKLSRDGQIDFEIYKQSLEEDLWSAEHLRDYETDPRTYNDYLSGSVYALLAQSTADKETNIKNAIARIKMLPPVLAAARESLDKVPLPVLETSIRQHRGVISFYEKGIFQLAGETSQQEALDDAAASIVGPLKEYQRFLEGDLRKRATDAWRLGKERFNRKLQFKYSADQTADHVLADAEDEFARVRNDMYIVARQLWSRYFPKETLPPDDRFGRRETTARVLGEIGKEHGKPEHLLRDAQGTVAKLKEFIAEKDILRLPDPDRCQIIEMPEFKRGNSLAYIQSAPPLDPKAPTIYAISPPPSDWSPERVESFLQEYNRHMLQILTIHEAYPGHYVQLEYSNREPSLVRRIHKSGVFIEGWAVYTEQMMLDQGYGDGDLALRLTQLKFYLRAVANAILDHRMHCTEMTDDEALNLLMNRSFQSEGEARLKIIRAKQTSVQLSTYFVGRMAHYRLRRDIQRELGDRFNLGAYHEAVMDHGSVPVRYLPELVRRRLWDSR